MTKHDEAWRSMEKHGETWRSMRKRGEGGEWNEEGRLREIEIDVWVRA